MDYEVTEENMRKLGFEVKGGRVTCYKRIRSDNTSNGYTYQIGLNINDELCFTTRTNLDHWASLDEPKTIMGIAPIEDIIKLDSRKMIWLKSIYIPLM